MKLIRPNAPRCLVTKHSQLPNLQNWKQWTKNESPNFFWPSWNNKPLNQHLVDFFRLSKITRCAFCEGGYPLGPRADLQLNTLGQSPFFQSSVTSGGTYTHAATDVSKRRIVTSVVVSIKESSIENPFALQ